MNDILTVKDLDYYYIDGDHKRIIFDKTNISFIQGLFYTILGQSGSGKTTFLSLIAGLDKPKGGTIYYEDRDINDIGLDKYRRNYVSMVFQNYNLINYMNAYDNVVSALDIAHKKYNSEQVYDLLNRFGIDKTKANRKVNKLSGGEQQRVAIARAISTDTKLIIADEPTGNLDNETSNTIVSLFKELSKTYNKTVIVVTHNDMVAKESDSIITIDQENKKLIYVKWYKKNTTINKRT